MSLLMDALKKAEQEKREAAKRLKTRAGRDQFGEVTGANEEPGAGAANAAEITSEQPIQRMDPTVVRSREEIFAATSSIALAPMEDEDKEKKMERADRNREVTEQDTTDEIPIDLPVDKMAADRHEVDELDTTGQLRTGQEALPEPMDEPEAAETVSPLDETIHGATLDREISPDLYQETIKGEPFEIPSIEGTYDETLPGVPAAELVRDIGGKHQPTPVAAQTVFTAAGTTGTGINWAMITGGIMVIVIALGIVVYYSITPVTRDLPSPLVARRIEQIIPHQLPADISAGNVTGTTTQQPLMGQTPAKTQTLPAHTAAEASAGPASGVEVAGGASEGAGMPAVQAEEEGVAAPPRTAKNAPAGTGEPLPVETNETVADAGGPAEERTVPGLPASIEVTPALIKISRSKVPDDRGKLINDAYQDFQNGDYVAAKSAYQQALQLSPDNRDALLGLGAVAINNGDILQAFRMYSRLLRIDPEDTVARAILINLQNKSDLVNRESTIKLLAFKHPKDPFLHFTLGNVYAAQQRWAEAQQAFFDAYRYDSSNPGYALNLAISLDHIGQTDTALDYYNAALQLTEEKPASFNTANVIARIKTLSTNAGP
ncbi:MAG: tetratricopeptide repeat protein [Gammaproteobacteria bacterium]